jgi:hypothetical protein
MTVKNDQDLLEIKIIQSGKVKTYSLSDEDRVKKFKDIYNFLLKELDLKKKDVLITNDHGKAVSSNDLNLPLSEMICKFGKKLNLYSEKIM